MLTCKHVGSLVTPQSYRVVTLLDNNALSSFSRALEFKPANALHIQHLWIGSRDLDISTFFPLEDWVGSYYYVKDNAISSTIARVRSILHASPKILSLALPARLFGYAMIGT